MNATPRNRFARTIEAARLAKGWSCRKTAAVVGVHVSYYSRLERGERSPSRKLVPALADALGLDRYLLDNLVLSDQMPELGGYLRSKYELPPDAVAELEAHFRVVQMRLHPVGGRRR